MSEIPQLGRSGIYVWILCVFVLLQLPTGFSVDVVMFLVFHLVSSFVGSPILATGGATITGLYGPARAAFAVVSVYGYPPVSAVPFLGRSQYGLSVDPGEKLDVDHLELHVDVCKYQVFVLSPGSWIA